MIAAILALAACGGPPETATPAAETDDKESLSSVLKRLLDAAEVPGAAYARLRDGGVAEVRGLGLADVETGRAVTADTRFEAASLTKPVVAYAVLRLASRGALDLDRPLVEYRVHDDLRDDPRLAQLTARRVLSHTTGLPNWRPRHWTDDPGPLTFDFEPGSRFGYSGEGYVYLQKVVEKITGSDFERVIEREVFAPLGMTASSLTWLDDEAQTTARPHDFLGEPETKRPSETANAAASLHTTAGDYARFVAEILRPRHVDPAVIEEMLTPQVEIEDGVAWGLGWGLEPGGDPPTFWHWGDNGSFRCFVMASRATGDGLVLFTNSRNGLAIAEPAVEAVLGGGHPAFAWLDYERYDAPGVEIRRRLVRAGLERDAAGVEAALDALRGSGRELEETALNRAGYDLLDRDRTTAAIAVLRANLELHPDSWNVYDSLAEAHAKNGERERAIELYRQSLEKNPDNDNARRQIERLRAEL